MQRTVFAGYKIDPMQVTIFRHFDEITGTRPAIITKDLGATMQGVELLPDEPKFPRMTSALTIPSMSIIREYTFEDWNNQYENPKIQPLGRFKASVATPATSTVIQVNGDILHKDILAQFSGEESVDEIYGMMRNIAFARGELLAEYNQTMQRYPDAVGITEWYKAIAAVDPNKQHIAGEHPVEDFLTIMDMEDLEEPEHTPDFVRIYAAMELAASKLSHSANKEQASIFTQVTQYAVDKLQEEYKIWCNSFEPNAYLSKTLEKLPEEYHQAVSEIYAHQFAACRAENPSWSDARCAASAMRDTIVQMEAQVADAHEYEQISYAGRVPTSLDVQCFENTREEVKVSDAEMSAVAFYGGDAMEPAQDEVLLED